MIYLWVSSQQLNLLSILYPGRVRIRTDDLKALGCRVVKLVPALATPVMISAC